MRIHLDPLGGVAGDMFVAAVLAAFPHLRAPLLDTLGALRTPLPTRFRLCEHADHTLQGFRFDVQLERPAQQGAPHASHQHTHQHTHGHTHGHELVHEHEHVHVPCADVLAWIAHAGLTPGVQRHACAIFELLAEAEAQVHGVTPAEVEFHEVGAWDSIADVVAAAFLIDALGEVHWTHGPLPLGSGTVRSAHGVLPVPAPATLLLLRDLPVVDDGVPGERVTPTGAAILRHLSQQRPATPLPELMTVGSTGFGFGTRRLPGRANALRCTAYVPLDVTQAGRDAVICISFEIDDQTSEDLAAGLDRLRARDDVLQVTQTVMVGKKGRMVAGVQVLAADGREREVSEACFRETTTIGLRAQRVQRYTLPRELHEVALDDGGPVQVKLCRRDGKPSPKAEMDDLARRDGGHDARERARRDAEHQLMHALGIDHAHHP